MENIPVQAMNYFLPNNYIIKNPKTKQHYKRTPGEAEIIDAYIRGWSECLISILGF
jgi:hypothetical protein